MTPSVKTKVIVLTAGTMFLAIGAIIITAAYVFAKEYSGALQARSLALRRGASAWGWWWSRT